MSQTCPPDTRRTCWVRLADIPLATRVAAAERLIRRERPEPYEALQLMLAAHHPAPSAGGWVTPAALEAAGLPCYTAAV